jgi:hypothetical protein
VTAEASCWPSAVLRQVGELDAVVGEHGVDAVRDGRNQSFQKGRGGSHVSPLDQLHECELRGAVDSHKEIEPALRGTHLSQIDVEIADRVALELLPSGLAAVHFRQPADAVPFQTAMQRRAGQVREGRLQSIEAIIEGQQSMPAESNNDGFFLHAQDRRVRMLRSGAQIGHRAALPPLSHRLGVDSMTASQRSQALLTMLYRSTDRLCRSGASV